MTTTKPLILVWDCPECGESHRDEQHPVDGPFITVTCSNCGEVFDQSTVLDHIEGETT